MTTARVFISGCVQGVGYRKFVKKHATEIGLAGWVRNLSDKRVEMMFQGDKRAIEGIMQFCTKGPFLSEVENVELTWEKTDKAFSGFHIVDVPLM